MFSSFFPSPKVFFPAAILWTALSMVLWYSFVRDLGPSLSVGGLVGLPPQPLYLPLAHGDERLLRGQLASSATYRGRLAARPGRHHAVRRDPGRPRRAPDRRADDLACLPADPVGTVSLREGTSSDRRGSPGAGLRRGHLGCDRHGPARGCRHPAARARVPQPACRGSLSQGTGTGRRQRRPRATADSWGLVPRRKDKLLPPLPELPLLQHRPLRVSAGQ